MVELSSERIEQIVLKETAKKQEADIILRSVYTRYMCLFEKYFEDIDALNDDKVAELRSYHEETKSLVRYYYMDIAQDVCKLLREFDDTYIINMLGSGWHKYIFDIYKYYKEEKKSSIKAEEDIKAAFVKETLEEFYDTMDYIFRDGFGTGSEATNGLLSGIKNLLFGEENTNV